MSAAMDMGIKVDKAHVSPSASTPKVAPTAGGVTVPGVSLRDGIDQLAELVLDTPAPRVPYIERTVRQVNPASLTPQEREWMEQAQREDER